MILFPFYFCSYNRAMSATQNHYTPANSQSFMVHLWQEDRHLPWRASAQSLQTGETICFTDLASLATFLQIQTEPYPQQDNDVPV